MKRSGNRQERVIILTGAILAVAVVAVCIFGFFFLDSYIAEAAEKRRDREVSLSQEMQDELAQNPSAEPEQTEKPSAETEPSPPAPSPVKTIMPETQHDMTLTPTPDPQEYWATHPTATPYATPPMDPNAPVAAWIAKAGYTNMYQYTEIQAASYSATSVKEQSDVSYAFDGNTETAWADGIQGSGNYEILYAKLDGKQKVSCILFRLGRWTSYEEWAHNGRPSMMTIWLSGNAYQVSFPGYMEEYCLEFARAVDASELSFRIEGVEGEDTDDTYITDILIYKDAY